MDKQTQESLLEMVRRNYDDIAADFDRTRQKKIWPELERLAKDVPSGSRVLDAGCGNGRLAAVFSGRGVDYRGFDSSRELVKLAKANNPEADFSVGDILAMDDIPDGYFDYIFCIAVIPHIPGEDLRGQALRRLAEKLKEGGKLILSLWDLEAQKKYRARVIFSRLKAFFGFGRLDGGDLVFAWQGRRSSQRYYHAFSRKETIRLAASSGLATEKIYRADNNIWLILAKRPS